ncbi:hypothetical protein B566_EDAN013856 [Ephemera danica]|nr:hypothetical protein B566_EDAN013856 [Ephemera danica]
MLLVVAGGWFGVLGFGDKHGQHGVLVLLYLLCVQDIYTMKRSQAKKARTDAKLKDAEEMQIEDLLQVKLENASDEETENPVTINLKPKPFSCVYCIERFDTAADLKQHEVLCQEGEHTMLCHFCNAMFETKSELNQHISRVHIASAVDLYTRTKKQKHLPCKYCNETYFTQRGLDSHVAKKHIVFVYGKTSPTVVPVEEEFHYPRIHKSLNPSMNYEQKQIINLKAEFALKKNIFHEDSKKFLVHCINCTKDFLETTFFDTHLPSCLKNKVFQCSFCGKLKSSIDEDIFRHIMKHFYKHSGYCKQCNMHFVNAYNENCHKEKIHEISKLKFASDEDPGDSGTENKARFPLKLRTLLPLNFARASKREETTEDTDDDAVFSNTNALALYITKNQISNPASIAIDSYPHFLKPSEKGRQNIYTRINCAVALPTITNDAEVAKVIKDLKLEVAIKKYALLSKTVRIFCNKCETAYQVIEYIDHIKTCFVPVESKCEFCSIVAEFKSTQDFLKHTKIHLFHHSRMLDCSVCDISYLNHFNYKSHSFHFHGSLVCQRP